MRIITSLENVIESILSEFAMKITGRVLEIGPYRGSKTRYLCRNPNLKILGLDIDIRNSKWAKGYDFTVGDAKKLPFSSEIFDVVVSFDVIEHIDKDELFAKEVYRVLKKNGILCLGTPNRHRLSHKLRQLLGRKIVYPLELAKGCIHLREYTMEELECLMRRVGFEVTREIYVWFGLVGLGGVKYFPNFLKKYVHYLFIFGKKTYTFKKIS